MTRCFCCRPGLISLRAHLRCETFTLMFLSVTGSPALATVDDSLIKLSFEVHVLYIDTGTIEDIWKYWV